MAEAESRPESSDRLNDVLLAVAGGDSAAFENLYRTTSAKLFGICLRVLPQRAEAEEVLQEVFLGIWRKAGQFDATRASAMTWLSMMTRNKAIDRLRANASARAQTPIELDEIEDASTASEVAEIAQDRERINACLDELDAPRRQLVRVAFFEGASYEELAERSGNPLGTVKSWIRRSLIKLKACLER
ncbi:MAG: sigma-70 family RNA polymerase sigma factor [Dokdonella sp.]|uniref:sigma-70 family RNA polymerase sigma factor n=1 Tax=Dokdonella sp. TaxID=2291710 RepID=UPI002BD67FDD|nr:sigma-70 family RNA polymerase sigma factor [Dokdonella sp.]HOX70439.1 sigma-70 family RNA polymerase sigma factor [Dokdonella sp.]HPG94748.1 sigma-70 family RNA polymerase sigma factor [Dokdonella sp.]HPN78445.1 sigma-70 family RNA polymerase sigma factor [Dokdonella sp.]